MKPTLIHKLPYLPARSLTADFNKEPTYKLNVILVMWVDELEDYYIISDYGQVSKYSDLDVNLTYYKPTHYIKKTDLSIIRKKFLCSHSIYAIYLHNNPTCIEEVLNIKDQVANIGCSDILSSTIKNLCSLKNILDKNVIFELNKNDIITHKRVKIESAKIQHKTRDYFLNTFFTPRNKEIKDLDIKVYEEYVPEVLIYWSDDHNDYIVATPLNKYILLNFCVKTFYADGVISKTTKDTYHNVLAMYINGENTPNIYTPVLTGEYLQIGCVYIPLVLFDRILAVTPHLDYTYHYRLGVDTFYKYISDK